MPFPNIGAPELIVILIIALVVLGPGKLPDVAASLGKSVREFRKAATDVTEAGKLTPPVVSPTPAAPAALDPVAPAAPAIVPGSTEPGALAPSDPAADPKLS